MEFEKIKNALKKKEGERAKIRGWIYRKRKSGKRVIKMARIAPNSQLL